MIKDQVVATIEAGTIIHLEGCPLTLKHDTEVLCYHKNIKKINQFQIEYMIGYFTHELETIKTGKNAKQKYKEKLLKELTEKETESSANKEQ